MMYSTLKSNEAEFNQTKYIPIFTRYYQHVDSILQFWVTSKYFLN